MGYDRRTLLLTVGAFVAISGCLGVDDEAMDADDSDDTEAATADDEDVDDDMATDDAVDETDVADDPDDSDDSVDDAAPEDAVQLSSHADFGDILVGPDGFSLYMFDADEQGSGESACHDDCVQDWPPLTVEYDGVAGDDVTADISTFERPDGSIQVAADGWPLYYWVGDSEAGDANGQGINDVWWVLDPAGSPIRDDEDDDASTGPASDY